MVTLRMAGLESFDLTPECGDSLLGFAELLFQCCNMGSLTSAVLPLIVADPF
jgi:hypothetical protein